ncbi:Adenylosuccinate synthetase [compost metagenome]
MLDIIYDGMAGSCGKGKFAGYLALRNNYDFSVNNFMTNAGHTWVSDSGEAVMVQHLSQSVVDGKSTIYISAGAAITPETLLAELEKYKHYNAKSRLRIHPRAMIIEERHRASEAASLKRIGSTTKGCGHALADKVMRDERVILAKDHPELKQFVDDGMTHDMINILKNGGRGILEMPQGYDLDVNHGLSYPECTSRQTTPLQGLADAGIPHTFINNVIATIRTYPIRVGNVFEDGKQIGFSGPYADAQELTWEEIERMSGAPAGHFSGKELTTVTQRLRRVFTPSWSRLRSMVGTCAPTTIALNFAQYLDINAEGATEFDQLSDKVKDFIYKVEAETGVSVGMIGTGAKDSEIIIRGGI